jgi:hypothetical protein
LFLQLLTCLGQLPCRTRRILDRCAARAVHVPLQCFEFTLHLPPGFGLALPLRGRQRRSHFTVRSGQRRRRTIPGGRAQFALGGLLAFGQRACTVGQGLELLPTGLRLLP